MAESEWGMNKTFGVLAICATLAVASCNAMLIAERANTWQVERACVAKTGSPSCRVDAEGKAR